jgi:hypothetical protein
MHSLRWSPGRPVCFWHWVQLQMETASGSPATMIFNWPHAQDAVLPSAISASAWSLPMSFEPTGADVSSEIFSAHHVVLVQAVPILGVAYSTTPQFTGMQNQSGTGTQASVEGVQKRPSAT